METLFILSELMLIVNFILRKKTDNKQDIINFSCLSIVLLLCYNTFVCYILTFFTIPCKLWILSLINFIVSAILIIYTINKKEIQKYIFNKIDILYIAILTIIILAVCYINFGFPFNVNYTSSDPSIHYLVSMRFAEQETLMPNSENDIVHGQLRTFKPNSYVNSGLLMKCFCKNLDTFECYNVFVAFDIFTLVMIAIMIYSALRQYATNKEHEFYAFIVALICALGYPLNSFLFGFEYLTMGLLVLASIINTIYYYEKEILKTKWVILIMTLLNFGLFCSYYMFVPFVYPALWIYFCIKNYNKTKKIITKELVLILIIALIIPFILGYIYHLEPDIYKVVIDSGSKSSTSQIGNFSNHIVSVSFAVEGYIYINLYSNMILLLPLAIYLFIKKSKEKKLKEEMFLGLLVSFAMLFIELLLICNSIGKVSTYYLIKNYFALWIILAFINYKALIQINKNNKYISRLLILAYIILMIVCTIFSNVKVNEGNKNEAENILAVMEIFGANKKILKHKISEYNQKELDILKYAKNNLNFNSRIEIISTHKAYYWAYSLLRYTNPNEKLESEKSGIDLLEAKWLDLKNKKYNKENIDYVIYFNKTSLYRLLKDEIFENARIIYQNEAGGILEYNK